MKGTGELKDIPTHVQAGSLRFNLLFKEPPDGDTDGELEFSTQEILVNPHLAEGARNIVLCHELVHAILSGVGIRYNSDAEERLAEAIGSQLPQFVRDNWGLLEYIRNPQAYKQPPAPKDSRD